MTTAFRSAPSRADELQALEELWAAPAARPRGRRSRPHFVRLVRALDRTLLLAWGAALVVVIGLAPAPNPEASPPLWANLTLTAWWIALLAAGILAWSGRARRVLACSALSAGCGVALGYACRATEHHVGSWWLVETAAFGALALLSVAGLAVRRASAT
jgi:hypothetical protein